MVELGGEEVGNGHSNPWTITHGFYAVMGGFVLENPRETPTEPYLPPWLRNGVLTPQGVRYLMEYAPELVPDVHEDELLDRSKADGLAKTLLVWQVVWFCISCFRRWKEGLPLSLLEVTTLAHASCALLTYAFWWSKPKDVGQPTVIGTQSTPDKVRQIGAWMARKSSPQRSLFGGMITFTLPSEFDFVSFQSYSWRASSTRDRQTLHHTLRLRTASITDLLSYPWKLLHGVYTRVKLNLIFRHQPVPWYLGGTDDPVTVLRSQLASLWQKEGPGVIRGSMEDPDDQIVLVVPVASLQSYACGNAGFLRTLLAIMVLSAAYGLPHFLGFTTSFATFTEQRLWQIATGLAMAIGVVTLPVLLVAMTIGTFLGYVLVVLSRYSEIFASIHYVVISLVTREAFRNIVLFTITTVYIVSSLYLVGESLRQLSSLPPGAFLLPSWGNYWPHFG